MCGIVGFTGRGTGSTYFIRWTVQVRVSRI